MLILFAVCALATLLPRLARNRATQQRYFVYDKFWNPKSGAIWCVSSQPACTCTRSTAGGCVFAQLAENSRPQYVWFGTSGGGRARLLGAGVG